MGEWIKPDYDQIMLFPSAVEDWIGPDHPARFLRDFVDALDVEALGFKIPAGKRGVLPIRLI